MRSIQAFTLAQAGSMHDRFGAKRFNLGVKRIKETALVEVFLL